MIFSFSQDPKDSHLQDFLQHIVFIELLTCVVYIEVMWYIIIWYVRMGDEVVDGIALNTKRIIMPRNITVFILVIA